MALTVISVLVSEDEMQASLRISSAPDGLAIEDLQKELRKVDVVFGIDEVFLQKIIDESLFNEDHLVAKGREPILGEDSRKEFFFDINPKEPKPVVNQDGSVDHYNLDTVLQVEAGTVLARMIPPTKGMSGMTVTGKELKTREGRDFPLRAGYNVIPSDSGLDLIAKIAGSPKLIGNKIHISTQYVIETDVDFSTGNIEFNGDVLVKGAVLDGFSVKASGDVDVKGNIKNAIVEAGGTVNALGGIVAKEKGHVKAGVNVNAIFIESANVEAGQNVDVKRAIMHSRVKAGNAIFCQEGKGLIVGGELSAGYLLQAKEVGSEYATKTLIETGKRQQLKTLIDELSDEFDKCRENFNKLYQSEKKLQESLSVLAANPADAAKADQMKLLVGKTIEAKNQVMERIRQIKEEKNVAIEQLEKVRAPRVSIAGDIYPGVEIILDGYKFKVERAMMRATFFESDGKVKAGKYVPDEKD